MVILFKLWMFSLAKYYGSHISLQLLRLRRPFVAYITDALGNELFRVRIVFMFLLSYLIRSVGFSLWIYCYCIFTYSYCLHSDSEALLVDNQLNLYRDKWKGTLI